MPRAGLDARTGRLLYGWDHCVQSILKILTTELNERVQRRAFGSIQPRILDRPQNQETVIDIYVSVAEALEPRLVEGNQMGEPGFVLLRSSLDVSEAGKLVLLLSGVFFENGHLGDYSNPTTQEISFPVTVGESGLLVGAA